MLSLGLALLKWWETFFQRAVFTAQCDWVSIDQVFVLRVGIADTGRRKGTIQDIRFRQASMPAGRGWTPYVSILERLPIVLDRDEAVAFHVSVPPASSAEYPRDAGVEWHFEDGMRTGQIDTLEVEPVGGTAVDFDVPALPIVKEQWRRNIIVMRGVGAVPRL
ncbi:MAG TPA: hypothetical protein VFY45_15470 [Baekduia sp.]|nr:hypothetical protein [Baekduia sp.]